MSTRVRLPDGSYVTVPTTDREQAAAAARRYWQNRQQPSEQKPEQRRWSFAPNFGDPTASLPPPRPRRQQQQQRQAPRRQEQAPSRSRRVTRSLPGVISNLAGPLAPLVNQLGGETLRGFENNVTDNALPNWGDEIAGFGAGVGNLLTGGSFSDGYREGSRDFIEGQEQYKQDNPNLRYVSAGTGIGLSAAIPVGRAASAGNWARRSAEAAAIGAGFGAAAGAGDGNTLSERADNAVEGGFYGGLVGGALPGTSTAAVNTTRWARRNIPGVDATLRTVTDLPRRAAAAVTGRPFQPSVRSAGTEMADRMIAERMNQGNISNGLGQPGRPASPQAIAEEVAQRNSRGVPAMVGDVTEEMRGLTEYSSRGIGPGQALVRRAIEGRKATEGQRVRQHVQETFPTTDDPIKYVEDATRRVRQEAAPLYDEAYNQPIYRTPEIQAIEQTPAFRDALPQAYRNIQNQIDEATGLPKNPNEMGFREMVDVDPAGLPPGSPYFQTPDGRYISYENGLSTEGYDQVIRAMRDQGKAASNINPVTGRVESTTNSVHINNLTRDLQQRLGAQNAPFREATTRYADEMGLNNAFRQGEDIGNLTGPEVQAILRSTPETAHEAFTRGAGTSMANEATRYASRYPNGSTANRVRQMVGDEAKQEALSTAQGNTGGVRELLDRLEYEQQGNLVYNRVNGNSATAQRQQLDQDLDTGLGIPTSVNDVARRIINVLADTATPQLQQEVKARIAQVVTASDAKTVNEVMEAIAQQAERDASFRRLLQKANIGASILYGSNIETE